jgi:hypothetical protein
VKAFVEKTDAQGPVHFHTPLSNAERKGFLGAVPQALKRPVQSEQLAVA